MPAAPGPSLRRRGRPARRRRALVERLPHLGLEGAVAGADRRARIVDVPGDAAGQGIAWDEADQGDERWWPQGVASVDGGRLLLVSWYAKGRPGSARGGRRDGGPGSRISVVDRSDPLRPRYGHVLLAVAPPRPLRGVRPVPVHAGGIAVAGGVLHVADTAFGLRTFDLDDLLAAVPDATHGHSAVLVEREVWRVPALTSGRARFSFLSVGRVAGELSLLAGEYRRAGQGSARLWRYRLDEASGLPLVDRRGRAAPAEVHDGCPPRMQGVAAHGATWWVSASSGEGRPGDLHVGAPGAFTRHRGVLPPGPEDLTWSEPGRTLWCATEWPGQRWVFAIEAQRWAP